MPKSDTVVEVEVWYDRYSRSWVVERKDSNGYQVGDTDHVYTRGEALKIGHEHARAAGIRLSGSGTRRYEYVDANGHRHSRSRPRLKHILCVDCGEIPTEIYRRGTEPEGFVVDVIRRD